MNPVASASNRTIGFFSDFLPRPDASSSNLRVYEVVSGLASSGHTIKYFWWLPTKDDVRYLDLFDESVEFHRIKMDVEEAVAAVLTHNLSQVWFTNLWGTDWIRCASEVTKTVKRLNPEITVVADTMDYHAKKYYRKYEKSSSSQDLVLANCFFDRERELYEIVDGIITVSPMEARDISLAFNEKKEIKVIGNIHSVSSIVRSFDNRDGFVFLGNYRVPHNIDAVRWFLDSVSPSLGERLPHAKLFLVGKYSEELPEDITQHPIVNVVGFVEDISQQLSLYRCMVVPMTYGAGLKGKIGSAVSCGLPIVTTTIGAEGYPFEDNEHAFICDDPSVFADKCIRLHEEKSLWNKMSVRIIEVATNSLSRCQIIETLLETVKEYADKRRPHHTATKGVYSSRSLPEFIKVMSGASRKNRVAVIEPTLSHQETFHSLIKYFGSLGFGVDFILRSEQIKSRDILETLTRVADTNTAFFYVLNPETVEQCVSALNSAGHQAIFFNTIFEYWLDDSLMDSPAWAKLQTSSIYAYMHHRTKYLGSKLRYPKIPDNNIFTLGESISKQYNLPLLCPSHFYVEEAGDREEPGKTHFLCVGGGGDQRRNYSQLIDACINLNKKGFGDKYRIEIFGGDYTAPGGWIGRYKTSIQRYGLEANIQLKGETPFKDIFTSIRDSDYLLFLIDMKNPYSKEYLHDKITGSLNLSLGFGVVPVLDKQLADNWDMGSCSVTYSGYQEFLDILLTTVQQYIPKLELQCALKEKNKRLMAMSIENLKSILFRV